MSAQPNPAIVALDKEAVLALLHESRERFLNILDTVEHLITAETIQLKLISTQPVPRPADAPNREQAFLNMVADRSRKMEAPEPARPTGRFATLADAAAQFKKTRGGVIQFAEQNTAQEMRANEVKHPHPAAGNVSLYEMLIIMARHAERHAAQIEEIKSTLGLNAGKPATSSL
jgi:hypothetical protein